MPDPMTDTYKPPGQINYEAFDKAYPADRFVRLTWDEQAAPVQATWEAAAAAVLAHIPGYAVEYDENGCAWLIEHATRLRMALSHGMTLRIEQITLPAYQQQEHPDA